MSIESLPDGLPTPQRYYAIFTLMMAIAITVLDSTMVNVPLCLLAWFGARHRNPASDPQF